MRKGIFSYFDRKTEVKKSREKFIMDTISNHPDLMDYVLKEGIKRIPAEQISKNYKFLKETKEKQTS